MESLRNLLLILIFTCLSSSYADIVVDMQNATETKSLSDVISTTLNPTTTRSTTVTPPFIPTTTVAPKPTTSTTSIPPEPETSLWYVTDKSNNNTCILLEAGIRMTFNYRNTTGQIVKDYWVDIPSTNVNISGHCGALEQQITLKFFDAWTLSFNVTMNKTDEKYDLTGLSLTYQITPAQFPNAVQGNLTKVPQNIKMFKTDATRKYVCISHQTLVERNDTVGLLSITTYTLSLEAFRNSTSHSFTNSANHCANDEVSQLVPIIVGAALAGLIIIVLIAYVIGRHRARSGYASV